MTSKSRTMSVGHHSRGQPTPLTIEEWLGRERFGHEERSTGRQSPSPIYPWAIGIVPEILVYRASQRTLNVNSVRFRFGKTTERPWRHYRASEDMIGRQYMKPLFSCWTLHETKSPRSEIPLTIVVCYRKSKARSAFWQWIRWVCRACNSDSDRS